MCVIVVQDGTFPGWDTLENCWNRNSDGAGIMFRNAEGKVQISKGFMSFYEFKESVKDIPNYKTASIVYHFRIATHGTIKPENTHPYPYSNVVAHMKALDVTGNIGIAHNGIIRRIDHVEQLKNDISDTAEFIIERYRENAKLSSIINTFERENARSHSRFAIMTHKRIVTIGTWYDIKGCKFSNGFSHLPFVPYKRTEIDFSKLPYTPFDECSLNRIEGEKDDE